MAIKVVILVQQTTSLNPAAPTVLPSAPNVGYTGRAHIAGWSESMMYNGDDVALLQQLLNSGNEIAAGLLPARAALLGGGAAVIGVRLYQGGAGKGQSFSFSFPGIAGAETDIPQAALLCKGASVGSLAVRRFTLRGVPDVQIAFGEFSPTVAYATAVRTYFNALTNFGFLAFDPGAATPAVFKVTAAGLVTMVASPQPFTVGQIVVINRTLDATQIQRTFRGMVAAIGPLPGQFTLADWDLGATTGGTATRKVKIFFGFAGGLTTVSRVVTRRVGRPFEQYHGRRSKKRKIA